MQATNVKLSGTEMALVCNSEVLLTKNRIIEKVYALFGELSENYLQTINNVQLPAGILIASPKISRGENYLGLPWVILDYPRYFKGNDFFSIRTFFWWGNYFSMVLLLKGKWLELVDVENIMTKCLGAEWFISTINDPWQYHIFFENTMLVNELSANAIRQFIDKHGFLKLQAKIRVEDWDNVQDFMTNTFTFLINEIITITKNKF